jgi:hypothetical protein
MIGTEGVSVFTPTFCKSAFDIDSDATGGGLIT